MKFPLHLVYDWYRQIVAHPKYRWWVIAGTLVYLLDPFDFMPDMLPLIGQLDDAMLATMVMTEVVQVLRTRSQTPKDLEASAAPAIEG